MTGDSSLEGMETLGKDYFLQGSARDFCPH